MAVVLTQIGNATNTPVNHWVCDDAADLDNIDVAYAPLGSTCYVVNDGDEYVLNSDKEWKKKVITVIVDTGGEG